MELEILEALALSDDRSAALAQLLPGSEDHDYYRALHAQHRGALAEAQQVLDAWPDRHGATARYEQLRLRQLLCRATAAPDDDSLAQLRDWLGVRHDHEAEVEDHDATRARPTRLPDGAFDPAALLRQAAAHDGNLSQITDEGLLELLAAPGELNLARRRVLLGRLGHTPDPQVVGLVAEELAQRSSSGFGALRIHRELTLDQLHALATLRPELTGHAGWVGAVITRLRPSMSVDLVDLGARAAFLEEVWRFLAPLPPVHNALKDHVLWHLFDTARRRGALIDPVLVRLYLALPRAADFAVHARFASAPSEDRVQGGDFASITGLPPGGSDTELVRALIQAQVDLAESYAPWLDRAWLDAEIATAKLLAGTSRDDDRQARVLGPARTQALRDRIELAWCLHNPARFAADAPVTLEVDVKNVAELVIKVFRIDPVAYFQHHQREIDASVDLDGLAASDEQVLRFTAPAIHRVRRRIELPACARPGTYVIDLIGNGMASRAVIHKGRLRHVMRIGAAGQIITIFDDAGQLRPDARAWIGEREYAPDAHATIVVPFSTRSTGTAMLLIAGEVTTVAPLVPVTEHAALDLALLLDRAELTAGRTAHAIARLRLMIGQATASLTLLRDVTWDVTMTDRQGVAITKSQPLLLDDDDAAELVWPLGEDTAELAIAIRATLELRSEQRELSLAVVRQLSIATMHAGQCTEAVYLAHTATGWVVSALGKTGEPRGHRPVSIGLVHRWAHLQRDVELATDEAGRIELGALPGVRRIVATLGDTTQRWEVDDPPPPARALHTVAGGEVLVALAASRTAREALGRASLVEMRGGAPARQVDAALTPLASAIAVRDLAPGTYQLRAPGLAASTIVVTAPLATIAGWAVTPSERVRLARPLPAIAALSGDATQLVVQLHGGDAHTRVHVLATRFVPALSEAIATGPTTLAGRGADPARPVSYVSGRELGDEYRYVLERRAQPRYPGLLLDKPSLLLNPWARRTTTTGIAVAALGRAFASAPASMMAAGRSSNAPRQQLAGPDDAFVSYDFLAAPPVVLANLVADARGRLVIPRDALGDATSVTVIVDDAAGMTLRRIALPEPALVARDLRLRLALDPARHATQHKTIVPLAPGDALRIADLATAQVHLIDSVERAHAYLLALRDEPALRTMAFVTRWPALTAAEQRARYSEHACHELHLFLYFKDRAFFDAVIRPHLAHKRTPTFVDHWLLDADLAPYLEPVRLAQLNAVERALLALRLTAEPELVRQLADELAIQPRDPARDARLIDALLGAATLHGESGIAEAREAAVADKLMEMAAPSAQPRGFAKRKEAADRGGRGGGGDELADDAGRRDEAPLFRAADTTQEWAEHNWWQRTPAQSGADMIEVNRLWRDLAHHPGGRFLSPALGLATGSFAEAMCALAVLDLPFAAPAHTITADGPRLTIVSAGPALAGTAQLVDGPLVDAGPPLVVGTSYVRADDRHDFSSGEQVDKYVDGPLVTGVVYTCLVVLANPTSSRQRVAALIQIPRGSMPVAGARPTSTIDVLLEPYGTHGHEYSFYFPAPGGWTHAGVNVNRDGQIVAAAPGRTLEVQAGAAAHDPASWAHVSQRGTLADVVAYLATANLAAIDVLSARSADGQRGWIDVARIAWRLRDPAAYQAIVGALEARRAFDPTVWSYALFHRDAARLRTWLRARGVELLAAGPVLDMLGLDAEALGGYEHLELAPLINARAHRLGPTVRILNDGLAAQYQRFLQLVAHRAAPTPEDLLAAAHYLLAQDRVAPALAALARVDAGGVADRMQLDYLAGYAACLTGDLGHARALAARWQDHPVDRWRHRFAALAAMLAELDGAAPVGGDPPALPVGSGGGDPRSRDQQQAELAARQPTFELAADRDGVVVRSQHVTLLELRFFELDVELLFSRQPFVQTDASRFSFIEPAHRERLEPPGREQRVAWPAALRGKNVVVEAVAAGTRKARVHYANDLALDLAHRYGQLRVQRASDGRALAATYVKVYARAHGGEVVFYKDGYTDLRGWFDYASLSTTELDRVERFAILVVDDHAGAAILEAAPPAR